MFHKVKIFSQIFWLFAKGSKKTTDGQDKSSMFDLFCFFKKLPGDHVYIWG